MLLKIEKIISSGDGIGWLDGKTFFIPYSIPGELIEITACHKEKSYFKVTEFSIIEKSPFRRNPPCPNFTICGGCSFLHIAYANQAEIKKKILFELFKQKKTELLKEPGFVSIGEFNNRTRAKVSFLDNMPGFKKHGSNEHVPFQFCPLLHPELNNIIVDNRQKLKNEVQIEYSVSTKEWIPNQKKIIKTVLNQELVVSEGCFFQSSEKAAEALVTKLLHVIDKTSPSTMLDLFCGIGLFSCFAAKAGVSVSGIEGSPFSAQCYKENLGAGCAIKQLDINKISVFEKKDLIVIDPPRTGIEATTVEAISKSKTNNIVYISCNPSTFIRDFINFQKYGFAINEISILDLFPATNHFELFVHLCR